MPRNRLRWRQRTNKNIKKRIKHQINKLTNCKRDNCNKKVTGNTVYCFGHWCEILKCNHDGVDFEKIWNEQQGKCAITKIELVPGLTSSIDHVKPISKGGLNEEQNLRFIHIAINGFKNNMTEEEFKLTLKELLPNLQEYIKEK